MSTSSFSTPQIYLVSGLKKISVTCQLTLSGHQNKTATFLQTTDALIFVSFFSITHSHFMFVTWRAQISGGREDVDGFTARREGAAHMWVSSAWHPSIFLRSLGDFQPCLMRYSGQEVTTAQELKPCLWWPKLAFVPWPNQIVRRLMNLGLSHRTTALQGGSVNG